MSAKAIKLFMHVFISFTLQKLDVHYKFLSGGDIYRVERRSGCSLLVKSREVVVEPQRRRCKRRFFLC